MTLNPTPFVVALLQTCYRLLSRLRVNTRPREFAVSRNTYDALWCSFEPSDVNSGVHECMQVLGVDFVIDSTGALDDGDVMLRYWQTDYAIDTCGVPLTPKKQGGA